MNTWKKEFEKIFQSNEKEDKEYFDNFPFDANTISMFLICIKESNFLSIDTSLPISELLVPPTFNRGLRIMSVTENCGIHNAIENVNGRVLQSFEVKYGETYITINTLGILSGGVYTFILEKINDRFIIKNRITHIRS